MQKFLLVLTQRGLDTSEIAKEDDMATTLCVLFVFGTLLLIRGKIQFGNIYGFGLCGCFLICGLINLLTKRGESIQFYSTICILGNCLLPFLFLALAAIFFDLLHPIGMCFELFIVVWSAISATRFFELKMDMKDQRYLIMYPIALFYCVFVMLTVF
jgi:protein YIPF5/7